MLSNLDVEDRLFTAYAQYENANYAGTSRQIISEGYLSIDNIMTALLLDAGIDPTYNHQIKKKSFFKHFPNVLDEKITQGKNSRSIRPGVTKEEVDSFYDEWQKIRYSSYKITSYECRIRIIQVANIFQASIEYLAEKYSLNTCQLGEYIATTVNGCSLSAVDEHISRIHDERFDEAERIGEYLGCKLGIKMSETSNFCELGLSSDDEITQTLLRDNEEIAKIAGEVYTKFLQLTDKICVIRKNQMEENLKCTASSVENARNFVLSLRVRYLGATILQEARDISNLFSMFTKTLNIRDK